MNDIISYYSKTPPNKFKMADYTINYSEENRSCADTIEVFIKIENNKIISWSFDWITSIITTATASIFWESIIWMDLSEILEKDYDYMVELLWEWVSPRRQRAAVFWILATRNAIHNYLWDGIKDEILDLIKD